MSDNRYYVNLPPVAFPQVDGGFRGRAVQVVHKPVPATVEYAAVNTGQRWSAETGLVDELPHVRRGQHRFLTPVPLDPFGCGGPRRRLSVRGRRGRPSLPLRRGLRVSRAALSGSFRLTSVPGDTGVWGRERRVCSLSLTSAVWCISKRGRPGLCTLRPLVAGNRLLPGGNTTGAGLHNVFYRTSA